jgi:hypothetical protein
MEPDGHLEVTFTQDGGTVLPFNKMKTWRIDHNGWLVIFYENKSVRWPPHVLLSVVAFYNSQEYSDETSKNLPADVYSCQGCGTEVRLKL